MADEANAQVSDALRGRGPRGDVAIARPGGNVALAQMPLEGFIPAGAGGDARWVGEAGAVEVIADRPVIEGATPP